jgi:hypothetical protein
MPGSASFTPYPVPLDSTAVQVATYRFNRDASAGQRYTLLPNVQCLGVSWFDGPNPPSARFQYVFSDSDPSSPFPAEFDDVWPLGSTGQYVVQNDDELVVIAYLPDGRTKKILFDGFALIPQVDVHAAGQSVTFAAVGVQIRLWDNPVGGRTERSPDTPTSTLARDNIDTDLPTEFNPAKGDQGPLSIQPNCIPDGSDVGEGTATAYPVFLNLTPDILPEQIPDTRRTFWTLGQVARYLHQVYNKDQKYVKNPDATAIDELLECYAPKSGQFVDPNDPSTYTATPIVVRDFDATNLAWPDAIQRLIAPHGFSLHFGIESDANDEPSNFLEYYRKDAKSPFAPMTLGLQATGSILDPGLTNVAELHVARDNHPVANRWVIETRPTLYEVSVVLAPGYVPIAADAASRSAMNKYLKTALVNAADEDRAAYRRYVAGEDGCKWWDFASSTEKTTPLDLSSLGAEWKDGDGNKLYVRHARPGRHTLVSEASLGRPHVASLQFSRDYTGPSPALWDGTGTWQTLASWKLLKDRLGIECTDEDPEAWNCGPPVGTPPQSAAKTLQGITSQAAPTANVKKFYLLLTTVIEGDKMLSALADRRGASPSKFAVTRRVEARDHFQKAILAPFSLYNPKATALTKRDDSTVATSHAQAMRSAHEFPPIAGTVTIPSIAFGYSVANRVSTITGRNVSLRANVGASQGEAPEYPWIESVEWSFAENNQSTTLSLSDRRKEPPRV